MTTLEKAIIFATEAHAGMTRKEKTRPYILHPLEAMVIVSTLNEEEDVLAAAVLHDTVEDTGKTKADIEKEFGPHIANLVAAESEDKREDQPAESTWKIRKQETIDLLWKEGKKVKLICLGDKLSNLRELSRDYADVKDALWDRFNQKDKSMHCWYYSSIYEILKAEFGDVPAIREYRRLLEEVFDWKGNSIETD